MPDAKRKKIAIVTGASAGLGAEFARQIEANFSLDEIWLVARRAEPMHTIAGAFRRARGVVIALDLCAEMSELKKRLAAEQPDVRILVNNAGYGKVGPFAELGLEEQLGMVDLNIRALMQLSYIALPYMQEGSSIVQVASSAGFAALPNFSVYAATKAFVVSFSASLGYELREKGVQVLAVCPGPVDTEFSAVASHSAYQKKSGSPTTPFHHRFMAKAPAVVATALRDMQRHKRRSIYGFLIKAFVFLMPFLPLSLTLRALRRGK